MNSSGSTANSFEWTANVCVMWCRREAVLSRVPSADSRSGSGASHMAAQPDEAQNSLRVARVTAHRRSPLTCRSPLTGSPLGDSVLSHSVWVSCWLSHCQWVSLFCLSKSVCNPELSYVPSLSQSSAAHSEPEIMIKPTLVAPVHRPIALVHWLVNHVHTQ